MSEEDLKHWSDWMRTHWGIIIMLTIILLLIQVISQLYYPVDTALPRAQLAGKNVKGESRVEIAADVQADFQKKTIEIETASSSYTSSLSNLGASLESDSMAAELTTYTTAQRFIPFSVYWLRPQVKQYNLSFNSEVLQQKSQEIAEKLSTPPVDAALALDNGELVVTEAQDGQTVTPGQVVAAVQGYDFTPKTATVAVSSKTTPPAVENAKIAPVRDEAEAILAGQFTLRLPNGDEVVPSRKTITSWLLLQNTPDGLSLKPSKKAITAYIAKVNKKVFVAATPAQVTVRDGKETSRSKGKAGVTIDVDDLVTKLTNAINGSETGVVMDVLTVPVSPSTVYNRSYSSTQAGLRAYVGYTTSSENIRIALQQIGGKGWSASGRATESIPSASTYKLFVAMWLFDQMNKGKIHWNDPWLDTTVSGCFDRMTIASTNPCAVAWLDSYGRTKMNSFVYARGFSGGTNFALSDATHSTASDLEKFMIGLNNGSLVKGAQRDRLLHSLSVHPYRYGVPTGSAGTVYDKVGFLWDYVHDAAIVKHPKGTYIVVIMTKGAGGYSRIAQITRELEGIMYP